MLDLSLDECTGRLGAQRGFSQPFAHACALYHQWDVFVPSLNSLYTTENSVSRSFRGFEHCTDSSLSDAGGQHQGGSGNVETGGFSVMPDQQSSQQPVMMSAPEGQSGMPWSNYSPYINPYQSFSNPVNAQVDSGTLVKCTFEVSAMSMHADCNMSACLF